MEKRIQCKCAKEGILNIEIENVSPIQVFSKTVGLERLLLLIKKESERYAEQNRRMFQTTSKQLYAFLDISILMGINKFPEMKDYWSVKECLGNILIQKTITRERFLQILQNIHFANNLQQCLVKDSENYDCAWKPQPLCDHPMQHFQGVLQPESHQSIYGNMCKFKGKSLMDQYMKNVTIKWGFSFWFQCYSKSGCLYEFDMYLGKMVKIEFSLVESVVLSLSESLRKFFDNFFTSVKLILKLLENRIYGIETVKAN